MNSSTKSPWLFWLVPASFYAIVLILRMTPGVLMNDVIAHYEIDYTKFGLLLSFYYLGYSISHLPVGMLLTRFKVKYVMACFMLLTVFGILLLSYAPLYQLALFGALMLGVGSVVGMLGSSNIIHYKFYRKAYSLLIGLTLALGLAVATSSGKIIHYCLSLFNWQTFYFIVAIIILINAAIALIFLEVKQKYIDNSEHQEPLLAMILDTIKTPKLLLIALFGGFMTAPMHGFADVWGINYLIFHFKLLKAEAILTNSFMFSGMAISAPLLGYIAEKYQIYRSLIISLGILMLLTFIILITFNNLSYPLICVLLFMLGVGSSFSPLIFTTIIHNVNKKLGDIAIGVTNSIFMLFGFIYHPLIGSVIDFYSKNHSIDIAYMSGISVIAFGLLIGILGLSVVAYKTQLK